MEFVFSISPVEEHVHVTGCGNVDVAACLSLLRRLTTDPAFRPHFSILIDAREVSYTPLRAADLVEVADALSAWRDRFTGPIAVLTRGATLLAAEALATLVRVPGHIRMRVFVDLIAAASYCELRTAPTSLAHEVLVAASAT